MTPFETDAEVYDAWFERHEAAYRSELAAVRAALDVFAPCGRGLDIGLVPRNHFLGRQYETRRQTSRFYRNARFFSMDETTHLLEAAGFESFTCKQPLFDFPEKMTEPDPVIPGCDWGGFVVLSGIKQTGDIR